VRQGARLNNVATVAKLLPLLLLAGAGLFAIRAENLVVTQMPAADDVARTSILLIFAFSGVETALVPSGEVRDTARTVPRAILTAMLGITLLYILLQVVARGVLGDSLSTETSAPLAEAAGVALGGWARTLLLLGASVSMFGYVGGMTLAVPRALFAFARDGFLPRSMASVHPRYHTPHVAIIVQASIAVVLALSSTFERLAILANLATLVLYGACCVAAWTLRRRGVQQGGTPFRVPFAGVVPWLACLVIAWMLTSIRLDEWLALAVALGAAVVLFVIARRRGGTRAAGPTVA
jgi:amino acid transporter